MATGGENKAWKGDDFRHTCGLCMEPYSGRLPKLLPCFHTFCLPCLTTLAVSAAATSKTPRDSDNEGDSECKEEMEEAMTAKETDDSSDNQGRKGESGGDVDGVATVVFLCPTCRSPVTVPEGGVASLQTNFYLDYEQAGVFPGPVPCDMCEEGQAQDAAHACDKCQKRMCRACRRLHDMITDPQVHRVRPLGPEDQPTPRPKSEEKNCTAHPDQRFVMHCRKCDVSVCLICKLTSHEGHETEDMATAVKRAKEELTELRGKVNEQMLVLGTMLDRLDRDERELSRQKEEMTCEANTRYETVTLWAKRSRDELLEGMASTEQKLLRDLQAKKKSARATMKTFSDLEKRARLTHGSDPGVVSLKNSFKSALLTDNTVEEYRKHAARDDSRFLPVKSITSSLELDLVRAFIGQMTGEIISSRNAAGWLESLSTKVSETASGVQQLTKEVADLNTQMKALQCDSTNLVSQIQKSAKTAAFHALLKDSGTARGVILFKDVKSNKGNCFNERTGVFTTPCNGTYVFFATVRSANSEQASVKITVDGEDCAFAYGTKDSQGSTHVCMELAAGLPVCVKANFGSLEYRETAFSGALIQASV